MVVIDVFSRRIVGISAESGPIDGISVCRMFNRIIAGQALPNRISTDHDPLFRFHRWLANLRVLGVEEIKSVPYTPISHPYVERLIGTVRREFLDHLFFWNGGDLERKLDAFKHYYNDSRVHRSLAGQAPAVRAGSLRPAVARLDQYQWKAHCGGLFRTPVAA
jgi:putative transposase